MPASRAACALAAAAAALAASLPGVQPAGAAWDLRTTGRQVVVRGAQEHPERLPSFHMQRREDAAEECRDTGEVSFGSTDLELVTDPDTCAGTQQVGIRFQQVYIPHGATLTEAFLVFDVDEACRVGRTCRNAGRSDTALTDDLIVTIAAQSADNAEAFLEEVNNIARRPRTLATVQWSVPAWEHEHDMVASVDIAPVVREVLERDGWSAGNSIVFLIRHESGDGVRIAESFRQGTPELKVRWEGEMVLGSSGLDTYIAGQHASELERGFEPTYTDASGQTHTRTEEEFSGLKGTVYTHRGCHCLEMPFTSEAFEINSDDCKCTGARTWKDLCCFLALRNAAAQMPAAASLPSCRGRA